MRGMLFLWRLWLLDTHSVTIMVLALFVFKSFLPQPRYLSATFSCFKSLCCATSLPRCLFSSVWSPVDPLQFFALDSLIYDITCHSLCTKMILGFFTQNFCPVFICHSRLDKPRILSAVRAVGAAPRGKMHVALSAHHLYADRSCRR